MTYEGCCADPFEITPLTGNWKLIHYAGDYINISPVCRTS